MFRELFGFASPGLWANRNPVLASIALVLLLALCVISLPNFAFDNNLSQTFASKENENREIGGPSELYIVASASEALTEVQFDRLRELSLELGLANGVAQIVGATTVRFPAGNTTSPGELVFAASERWQTQLSRYEDFQKDYPNLRKVVSDDRKSALFVVVPAVQQTEADGKISLREIREIVEGFETPELTILVAGVDALASDIVSAVQFELILLNVLGGLFAGIVIIAILRDLRATLLATLPAVLALFVGVSLFPLLGFRMSVLSNVLPVLFLVLAMADTVHLTMNLRNSDRDKPKSELIARTLRDIGPACGLTALTTALALACVAVSESARLTEFAIVGTVGVIVTYLVVMLSFPLLAKFLFPAEVKQSSKTSPKLAAWLSVQLHQFRRAITVVAFAAISLGFIGYFTTSAWFPLQSNLPQSSDSSQAIDIVDEQFGGIFWVQIFTPELAALNVCQAEDRDAIRSAQAALRSKITNYHTSSVFDFDDWLSIDSICDDFANIGAANIPASLPGFGREIERLSSVLVFMPEPMKNRKSLETYDAFSAQMEIHGAQVVGFPDVLRHESLSVIGQLNGGLLLACFLAIAVVAIYFRSLLIVPVLIVPNLFPVFCATLVIHWLSDGHLTTTAVLALTVAFGIAVDDTLHFLVRYRLERQTGERIQPALTSTLRKAGAAMAFTTLILVVGLSGAFFSDFSTVRLFGMILCVSFVSALLADIVFLPAMLNHRVFKGLFSEKS